MLFNSPSFIFFFAAVFCLYWTIRRRVVQNTLLLAASYIFYGTWSWKFLLLLGFSTLLDYTCGRLVAATEDPRRRRVLLAASVVTNLGFLGAFKYFGFFVTEAAELLRLLGFDAHVRTLEIVLPVGISFYTFQSLSYVVDVYRRKLAAERNILTYALYVAFFPQLVAGPIERATHMLPQFKSDRIWSSTAVESGLQLMIWGLFKKIVIADNLAPYVNAVYGNPGQFSGRVLATATVFFAVQIYCDFSGYSDTARGTARALGFDVIRNFDLPYFSRTPVEFWRRWHISLSQWFQDYLYFPLAMRYMRRGGWASKYRAHIVSMTLIGLWHGASWTFVLFGLYWGLVIAVYIYFSERGSGAMDRTSGANGETSWLGWLQAPLAVVAMFVVACVGWILFRAKTIDHFWMILTGLFSSAGDWRVLRLDVLGEPTLWALVLGLWAAELLYKRRAQVVSLVLDRAYSRLLARCAMLTAIVFSYVVALQGRALPFIYFQF